MRQVPALSGHHRAQDVVVIAPLREGRGRRQRSDAVAATEEGGHFPRLWMRTDSVRYGRGEVTRAGSEGPTSVAAASRRGTSDEVRQALQPCPHKKGPRRLSHPRRATARRSEEARTSPRGEGRHQSSPGALAVVADDVDDPHVSRCTGNAGGGLVGDGHDWARKSPVKAALMRLGPVAGGRESDGGMDTLWPTLLAS